MRITIGNLEELIEEEVECIMKQVIDEIKSAIRSLVTGGSIGPFSELDIDNFISNFIDNSADPRFRELLQGTILEFLDTGDVAEVNQVIRDAMYGRASAAGPTASIVPPNSIRGFMFFNLPWIVPDIVSRLIPATTFSESNTILTMLNGSCRPDLSGIQSQTLTWERAELEEDTLVEDEVDCLLKDLRTSVKNKIVALTVAGLIDDVGDLDDFLDSINFDSSIRPNLLAAVNTFLFTGDIDETREIVETDIVGDEDDILDDEPDMTTIRGMFLVFLPWKIGDDLRKDATIIQTSLIAGGVVGNIESGGCRGSARTGFITRFTESWTARGQTALCDSAVGVTTWAASLLIPPGDVSLGSSPLSFTMGGYTDGELDSRLGADACNCGSWNRNYKLAKFGVNDKIIDGWAVRTSWDSIPLEECSEDTPDGCTPWIHAFFPAAPMCKLLTRCPDPLKGIFGKEDPATFNKLSITPRVTVKAFGECQESTDARFTFSAGANAKTSFFDTVWSDLLFDDFWGDSNDREENICIIAGPSGTLIQAGPPTGLSFSPCSATPTIAPPPPPILPPPTKGCSVSLRITQSAVTLLDRLSFTATALDLPGTPTKYRFEIARIDLAAFVAFPDQSSATLNFIPRVPGTFRLRVSIIDQDGTTLCVSRLKFLVVRFPDERDIERDFVVRLETDASFERTKDRIGPGITHAEEGFYILLDTSTEDFIIGPVSIGPLIGPCDNAGVNTGPIFAVEDSIFDSSPLDSGKFVVAAFHTHPGMFIFCDDPTVTFPAGPSDPDVFNANSFPLTIQGDEVGIPGLVYDFVGIFDKDLSEMFPVPKNDLLLPQPRNSNKSGNPDDSVDNPAQRFLFGPFRRGTPDFS